MASIRRRTSSSDGGAPDVSPVGLASAIFSPKAKDRDLGHCGRARNRPARRKKVAGETSGTGRAPQRASVFAQPPSTADPVPPGYAQNLQPIYALFVAWPKQTCRWLRFFGGALTRRSSSPVA